MSQHISQDFVQELLSRVDIVELVQRRITLKKSGSNYSACCPFHNEKTPSFTVSATKQFYHCFGCGAHGNAIGFLMTYDRLQFVEAVEELAHHAGIPIPQTFSTNVPRPQLLLYALLEKITQYYQSQLKSSPKALDYLNKRGVSAEIIQRFGLGFAPASWDQILRQFGVSNEGKAHLLQTGMLVKNEHGKIYDRFRDRLMIPIRDHRGRVIAFGGRTLGEDIPKYLNSSETPLFHKGSELFGLYETRQHHNTLDFCMVVEGYMDVIALHQFGITQAVSTMGTATNEKHLQYLLRHTKNLIFCFDGDNAGQNAAWRALENSLSALRDGVQIRFMFLPKEHDPDSLLRQEGIEQFKQRIAAAVSLSDFLFQKLSSDLNLESPDGKAKLVQLAKPHMQKIPEGVFRELILQQLAERVGTSLSIVLKHLATDERTTFTASTDAKDERLLFPIQIAIALLLQNPQLAQRITLPQALAQVTLPGVATLLKLVAQLKETPALSLGMLLEPWRDTKVAEQLAKLAVCELLIPPEGMEAELLGALYKIIAQHRDLQIQTLQHKMNDQTITAEEKTQLLSLLKERH